MIIQTSTKHATDKKPTAKDDVLLGGVWGNFTGWINIPKQPEWDIGLPIGYSGPDIDNFGKPNIYLETCKPYPTGSVNHSGTGIMIINRSLTHSKGPAGKSVLTEKIPENAIIRTLTPKDYVAILRWSSGNGHRIILDCSEPVHVTPGDNADRQSEPSGTVITMTQE